MAKPGAWRRVASGAATGRPNARLFARGEPYWLLWLQLTRAAAIATSATARAEPRKFMMLPSVDAGRNQYLLSTKCRLLSEARSSYRRLLDRFGNSTFACLTFLYGMADR